MSLERQLTIKDGLPLAIGSIIGSGILFLPSVIVAISGKNIFYVWVLMTLVCLPLLEIFNDMVKNVQESSGIEGFVSLGLGPLIGSTIPILFLGTISIGMPTAAIIAGKYLCNLIDAPDFIAWLTAVSIIFLGSLSNLLSAKMGSLIQAVITALLCFIGLILILMNIQPITYALPKMLSTFDLKLILSGMAVAMWAFAGFENLTFIAGEFKNPVRDFRICAYIALIISGFMYLGLSLAYAVSVKSTGIGNVASLYDLALIIHPQALASLCIVIFALICVQINTNSWIWGISRLVYTSALKGHLPAYFSTLNTIKIPARAIYFLATLYAIVFVVYAIYPAILNKAILLGSTNFTFIYILTLFSYVRFKSKSKLKIIAYIMLLLLFVMLLHGGWLVIYPLLLFFSSVFFHKSRRLLCWTDPSSC